MSLSGRRWTARQHLDHDELRMRKWALQHGLCATCTRKHDTPVTMELAHIIPDSKVNRRCYGRDVVDHPLNVVAVCKEMRAGRDCNAAQIRNDVPAMEHAERILRAMAKEAT